MHKIKIKMARLDQLARQNNYITCSYDVCMTVCISERHSGQGKSMQLLIRLSWFTPWVGSLCFVLGLVVPYSTTQFVNSQLASLAPVRNFTEALSNINNILRSHLEGHLWKRVDFKQSDKINKIKLVGI